MSLVTGRCIREFFWTAANKTFREGEIVAGEIKELQRLEEARVLVIDRQEETAMRAPPENTAARVGRARGR